MRCLFLLHLLLTPCGVLYSQFLWQFHSDTVMRWNYVDGDEFNNTEINKEKWSVSFPWTTSVPSQEAVIREANIKLDNGVATFTVAKDTSLIELFPWQIDTDKFKRNRIKIMNGNKLRVKYSISLLWLNQRYKYGYFEVKFLAPKGQGIWPAFWLYAAKENNEIDLLELKGEREKALHVDMHCPDGCGNYKRNIFGSPQKWGHWLPVDGALNEGFNVVAGEWTRKYIKYYLNGSLVAYAEHNFDMGMHLIIGTGIAKDGAPFKPGPNKNTSFPNPFSVDYVRVFKLDTIPNTSNLSARSDNTTPIEMIDTLSFQIKKKNKRLESNRDKRLKAEEVLTITVLPISNAGISVRVLGIKASDRISIRLFSEKGELIQNLQPKRNTEVTIAINSTFADLQMQVNTKEIKERIFLPTL